MKQILTGLLLTTTVAGLAACANTGHSQKDLHTEGQYWQRSSASSAIYMRGPKAQQMLNRDIATCVTDLKELRRLGSLKNIFPAGLDENGFPIDPDSPEGRMATFDTPERDGDLRTEVFDYSDFESCMDTKGWERVEYLPYARAKAARANYTATILEPLTPQTAEQAQSDPIHGQSTPYKLNE